jgi:hypothetical protein
MSPVWAVAEKVCGLALISVSVADAVTGIYATKVLAMTFRVPVASGVTAVAVSVFEVVCGADWRTVTSRTGGCDT